jgi:hypothetical protein
MAARSVGYVDWCENCREYICTQKAFGQKLKDKGFQMIRDVPTERLYIHPGNERRRRVL